MGDWDDSLKTFISENAQDFASWVLKGAQVKRKLLTEFKIRTIEADSLLEVTLAGPEVSVDEAKMLIHFEIQSTSDEDQQWIERIFAMYNDALEQTPTYQKLLQKGREEGLEKGREEALRQAVVDVVQERFPEITVFAQKQVESLEDTRLLRRLIAKMSGAQTVQEAVQSLITIDDDPKKN